MFEQDSAYLRVFVVKMVVELRIMVLTPHFGRNLQCLSFLLGVLAEMASHGPFSVLLVWSVDTGFWMLEVF